MSLHQTRSNISKFDVDRPVQASDKIRSRCCNKHTPNVLHSSLEDHYKFGSTLQWRWEIDRDSQGQLMKVLETADIWYYCIGGELSTGGLNPRTGLTLHRCRAVTIDPTEIWGDWSHLTNFFARSLKRAALKACLWKGSPAELYISTGDAVYKRKMLYQQKKKTKHVASKSAFTLGLLPVYIHMCLKNKMK